MTLDARRGITLLLPNGESLLEDVPWVVGAELLGCPEERLASPVAVHQVLLVDDGFSLAVDDVEAGKWRTFLFTPRWFDHYQQSLTKVLTASELEQLLSIDASDTLCMFVLAGNELVAKIVRKRIESGLIDFDDAKKDLPEVFSDSSFKQFFTESYLAGKAPANKAWKQPDPSTGLELYELAVSFRVADPRLSWAKAIRLARNKCPDLVPKSWKSDFEGCLQRVTSRNIEESRFSLRGWRKSPDK